MPLNFSEDATAGEVAQKIYSLSTDCLMAHSIRAVEDYLLEAYRFDTKIVLKFNKNVLPDMGRMSWCSVASTTGGRTYIFVQDNEGWERTKKRFCIAHELYHVIWSVGSARTSKRGIEAESLCDLFANDLSRKHDAFYADSNNLANIRFQGLPYRSV